MIDLVIQLSCQIFDSLDCRDLHVTLLQGIASDKATTAHVDNVSVRLIARTGMRPIIEIVKHIKVGSMFSKRALVKLLDRPVKHLAVHLMSLPAHISLASEKLRRRICGNAANISAVQHDDIAYMALIHHTGKHPP